MSVGGRGKDQSIGGLVSTVTSNVSSLVRLELELAKAELSESAKQGAVGFALLLVAGVLASLAVLLASFAAAYGFARIMPVWAAFLTVAGIYLVIGVVLALIGRNRLSKVRGPERAIAQVDLTKEALARQSEAHAQAEVDRIVEAGELPAG
ncbi:MAG: phage holin family protein [Actinomycetes bacterium]